MPTSTLVVAALSLHGQYLGRHDVPYQPWRVGPREAFANGCGYATNLGGQPSEGKPLILAGDLPSHKGLGHVGNTVTIQKSEYRVRCHLRVDFVSASFGSKKDTRREKCFDCRLVSLYSADTLCN